MSDKIRIAGLVNDSITDGPGLRLAIFMQGCERACPGCHNPSAWRLDGGEEYTPDGLWQIITANPLLTGVTLSGGEPLLQAEALIPLAEKIRRAGLSLAIYSGYTWEEITARHQPAIMTLLALADTLVDGPFIQAQRSLNLPFRGSANQRILDLPRSLACSAPRPQRDISWGV